MFLHEAVSPFTSAVFADRDLYPLSGLCSDGGWSEVEHKLRHPHTKADFEIMWLAEPCNSTIFPPPRDEVQRFYSSIGHQPEVAPIHSSS